MNYADWYTDTMDISRAVDVHDGDLTRQEQQTIANKVPCRIYQSKKSPLQMGREAASLQGDNKLMCGIDVNIRAGDEIQVSRGARIGYKRNPERYFVGEIQDYFEPLGSVLPGLAHKEISIMRQERVQ